MNKCGYDKSDCNFLKKAFDTWASMYAAEEMKNEIKLRLIYDMIHQAQNKQ